MWCFGEGTGLWSWFGGIGTFILWFGLIAFTVWGVISLTRSNRDNTKSNAMDIVKERYAKGEINKDEYDKYKKSL